MDAHLSECGVSSSKMAPKTQQMLQYPTWISWKLLNLERGLYLKIHPVDIFGIEVEHWRARKPTERCGGTRSRRFIKTSK